MSGQRKRKLRPGDKVRILLDERGIPEERKVVGQFATYEGRFLLNGRRYRGTHPLITTVGLQLSDGTRLWGYECSWEKARGSDLAKETLNGLNETIRELEYKRGMADARAGHTPAAVLGPYLEGFVQGSNR